MMIKAKHNNFIVKFFDWYISKIIRSDFSEFKYDNNFIFDKNKSILLIANHFSWWDGFFAYYLNLKLFKKNFHVMMLEKELEKRKVFSAIGAFSINPKSENTKESLDYTIQLLENANNLILLFPQGKIESNYLDEINFRKGIEYITNNSKQELQTIFSVNFIDYINKRKPTIYNYLKLLNLNNSNNLDFIQKEYNDYYQLVKQEQTKIWI
ncbi:MAG: lysophospholipid acyltransferase family protein [Candidatus Sericytochromatia bacterium]